jgi:hypothetical protein
MQYRRKAQPIGKSGAPQRTLQRHSARFVALEFILRKRKCVMVNATFPF